MPKREKKSRIDTSGPSEPLASPFSRLDLGALPDAPTTPLPPAAELAEKLAAKPTRKRGKIVLRRETAHRGGKTVVVVTGFEHYIKASEIEDYAREARRICGTGGTVKGREIEIQGEHIPKIREYFEREGFRVAGER